MKTNYLMTTDLRVLADYLKEAVCVAFDFETAPDHPWAGVKEAALDPHRGRIVGISLAVDAGTGVYLPLGHDGFDNAGSEAVLGYLREWVFENPAVIKIAHNLGFEAKFLQARGIALVPPVYDTMAGAQLMLKAEGAFRRLGDVGLKTLAREWFGLELPSYQDTVGAGSFGALSPEDVATIAYACGDADLALRFYYLENNWFGQHIPAHEKIIKAMESPVTLFTARMEFRGFLVDAEGIAAAETVCEETLALYKQRLETTGTRTVSVGLNAGTNDLKKYLFEDLGLPVLKLTETGRPSMDAEALDRLMGHCRAHQTAALNYLAGISDYRGLAKLLTTYIQGLGEKIHPVTGAIHTQFLPLGAETGRFASRHPNCQNLPAGVSHGVMIRDFFIAREGFILVAVDYSQIELRIGAWFTQDPNMLAVYQNDGDIHAVTTAAVYGISQTEARDKTHPDYKERRGVAKNINFGILYGLYPRGLQDILRLKAGQNPSLEACEAMIFNLRLAYPELVPWQEQIKRGARYRETVDTALGRRRCLTEINSPEDSVHSHYERAALNHPIQGTAADILKLGMVRLEAGLTERNFIHPLLTVHDEIVFEVETDRVAEAVAWIRAVMEAPPFAGFDVPLAVEVTVGGRYGSLTPWAE